MDKNVQYSRNDMQTMGDAMTTLCLDIYQILFDYSNGLTCTEEIVRSSQYRTELSAEEIIDNLIELIMRKKGDGASFESSVVNSTVFFKVHMHINNGEELDLSYILEYLNINYLEEQIKDNSVDIVYNNEILMYFDDHEDNTFGEIQEILESEKISYKILNQSSYLEHHGASDGYTTYIISIALGMVGNLATDGTKYLWKKINERLKNKQIPVLNLEIGKFDLSKILDKVSTIAKINKNTLYVSKFERVKKGKYKITLESRYKRVDLLCDEDATIHKFKISK